MSRRERSYKRPSGKDRKRRRLKLLADQNGLCHWCGKHMREDVEQDHPDRCTLDHVVPASLGGENGLTNLVAACFECNQARGNRSPESRIEAVSVKMKVIMPESLLAMAGGMQ